MRDDEPRPVFKRVSWCQLVQVRASDRDTRLGDLEESWFILFSN